MTAALLGLITSFPLTGFIYGFFACENCGNGPLGVFGKIFIGLVEGVLTTITFGAPWKNEGGGSSTNLRLYVLIAFLVLTILFYMKQKSKSRSH